MDFMRSSKPLSRVMAAACVVATLAGCSADSGFERTRYSDARARHYLFDIMRSHHAAVKRIVPYDTISEVLPNTQFKAPVCRHRHTVIP